MKREDLNAYDKNSKLKKGIVVAVSIFIALNMIIYPMQAAEASRAALALCANILIPSLFPFFVFSYILIHIGFAQFLAKSTSPIMRTLFGMPGEGAICFVLGIISGYPIGAASVCEMYNSGAISKTDSEKLLAFCNNSGPLFIVGSVGAAMYTSREIGLMLYVIHILSAISVGIILGLFKRKKASKTKKTILRCTPPIGQIIKNAVKTSVDNMLLICGFTILFAVIISFVNGYIKNTAIWLTAGALIEISTGIYNISISEIPICLKLICTSAALGFSGISVHLQVAGIVGGTNLSMKKYFLGKALHAVLASFYTFAMLRSVYVQTFAYTRYPIMSYEIIDFFGALKISALYIVCVMGVMLLFIIFDRIFAWQEKIRHGKIR